MGFRAREGMGTGEERTREMPRLPITLAVVLLVSGVTSLAAGSAAKPMSAGHWVVHDLGARVDIGTGDGGFELYDYSVLAILGEGIGG